MRYVTPLDLWRAGLACWTVGMQLQCALALQLLGAPQARRAEARAPSRRPPRSAGRGGLR